MKKNIFLIILTFMMVGCVSEGLRQTYGDDWMEANSDWRRGSTTSSTSTTVHHDTPVSQFCEQTVFFEKISSDWTGSSSNPVFSILLFSQEAAAIVKSKDLSSLNEMPVGSPCFRFKISGNLTFSTDNPYGFQTLGVYDNSSMQYINGLAVRFDGTGNVTLCLDKGQINPNQIMVYGQDVPNGSAPFTETSFAQTVTTEDFVNMIACTVALVPPDSEYESIGYVWATNLLVMKQADSFPSNVDYPDFPVPHTPAEINCIIGTVSNINEGEAVSRNLDSENCFYYTATNSGLQWFKFIIAGNGYSYQLGASNKDKKFLNSEILLVSGSNTDNVEFTSELGKTYKISYYIKDGTPYCIIYETEPKNTTEAHIGDIMYSDNTFSAGYVHDKTPIGIVFDTNGSTGKILHLSASSSELAWCLYDSEGYSKTVETSDSDGSNNWQIICNAVNDATNDDGSPSEKYPAFRYVYSLGAGWYLPAINELYTIYNNKDAINTALTILSNAEISVVMVTQSTNWSSTQAHENNCCSWTQDFYNGNQYPLDRSDPHAVRAIRAF